MARRMAHGGIALALALLTAGCGDNAPADDAPSPPRAAEPPKVASAAEIVAGAHVPTLDPMPMAGAEIGATIGNSPACLFRYTRSGRPILALRAAAGDGPAAVVKLNGRLVALRQAPATAGEQRLLLDDPARIRVVDGLEAAAGAGGEARPATVLFEIADALRAGYAGYMTCPRQG